MKREILFLEKADKRKWRDTLTDRTCNRKNRDNRNSGIELLKIFAIFLIVVSHVVRTLSGTNTYISYQEYVINLSHATTDLQQLVATMIRYIGRLGNTLFFVCSAWFLLDSKRINKRKMLQILMDIWVISVGIFVIMFFCAARRWAKS